MKLGYSSKSLNRLLDSQPIEFQTKVKDWWGNKLKIAFILAAVSGSYGAFLGFMLTELFK